MVAKKFQNPKGGLNEAGRKHFKKTEGSNLKRPINRHKFQEEYLLHRRFAGMKGPEKDEKGRPTRLALALKAWGFRSKESARNFANRHKKS